MVCLRSARPSLPPSAGRGVAVQVGEGATRDGVTEGGATTEDGVALGEGGAALVPGVDGSGASVAGRAVGEKATTVVGGGAAVLVTAGTVVGDGGAGVGAWVPVAHDARRAPRAISSTRKLPRPVREGLCRRAGIAITRQRCMEPISPEHYRQVERPGHGYRGKAAIV